MFLYKHEKGLKMKISNINGYTQTSHINHKGGIKSLNVINPISHYLDRYFNKMAKASANHIETVSPKLAGSVRFVRMNKTSAWDINPKASKNYILFLHGMSQNVSNYQRLYEALVEHTGVFALEYRGYGLNSFAKVSEDRLGEDVEQAYNYLTGKKQIKPENITVVGHSMGGALASKFASKHPDLKAMVLISPITKMSYLGKKFMHNQNLGVGIPERIQNLTERLRPLGKLFDFRFNSINKIKKVSVPTYIIQSKNDSVTSKDGTRTLIKAAKRRGILKEFKYLPYGGHKVDSNKISVVSDMVGKIYSKK